MQVWGLGFRDEALGFRVKVVQDLTMQPKQVCVLHMKGSSSPTGPLLTLLFGY